MLPVLLSESSIISNLGKKGKILKGEGRGLKGEEVNKERRKSRVAGRVVRN